MPTQANSFMDVEPIVIFKECKLEGEISRNNVDIKEMKKHLALLLESFGLHVSK